MDSDTADKFKEVDKALANLRRRLERVEGELHITDVDAVGVPNKGERTDSRRADGH